jgi:peroxiredoxin
VLDGRVSVAVSTRARRRGWVWVGALALLVAGVVVAARGGAYRAPVGRPAPPFALPTVSGRLVSLEAFRGHDVVLRFGSVACTVCDPDWAELGAWQAQAGPRVRILAVEVGQPASVVAMVLGGTRLPVPVLVDPTGAVARAYGVTELPSFAFVDRRGELVAVAPVLTRTGLWPTTVWRRYLELTESRDRGPGG